MEIDHGLCRNTLSAKPYPSLRRFDRGARKAWPGRSDGDDPRRRFGEHDCSHRRRGYARFLGARGSTARWRPQARKSVVSGRRVAVRVDLGGRRSIKKKNKKITKK